MHAPRSFLLCLAVAVGCDGGDGSTATDPPAPEVASLEIEPDSIELGALGQTGEFTLTARDEAGNALSSVQATWSSTGPDVATVDGNGVVTAEGGGRATIEVTADAASASATVVVRNRLCTPASPVTPAAASAVLPAYTSRRITTEPWPYTQTDPVVAPLDIGGDGVMDLYVATSRPNSTPHEDNPAGALFLLGYNASGAFTRDSLDIPPEAINSVAHPLAFDVDGDGLDDIFHGQFGIDAPPNTGALDLLLVQRNGTLQDASERLSPRSERQTNVYSNTFADVDCDGDVDLYSHAVDGAHLYVNDGAGNLAAEDGRTPANVSGDAPVPNYQGAGFCDVDGDSAPELVLAASSDEPDRLLRNDGFGQFRDAEAAALPDLPFGGFIVREFVRCDDFNGDGSNDLLLGESGDGDFTLRILVNDGAGMFTEEASRIAAYQEARHPGTVEAADLDGDGWTDLVLQCDVLMNNGGTFVRHALDPFIEPAFRCYNDDGSPAFNTVVPMPNEDGRVNLYVNTPSPTLLEGS